MTGQFDAHLVAEAAAAVAEVEDPRVRAHRAALKGDIVRMLKQYELRCDTGEACNAVRAHYLTSAEPITADALLHEVRKARLIAWRADQDHRDELRVLNERADAEDARAAVDSWYCDPREGGCGAHPNTPCINRITGKPMSHGSHLTRARKAYARPAERNTQ